VGHGFFRDMAVGIVLLVIGGPLFFLSTSWIEYIGILFALVGGILVIRAIIKS
jgi:hypothetical protein